MTSPNSLVTKAEVVASIHKLVKEGDPAKLTNRTIMNDIEEMFGNRLGPLQERLKNIVRTETKAIAENPDLLNGVEGIAAATEKTEKDSAPAEGKEKKPSEVVKEPSLVEQKDKEEDDLESGGTSEKTDDVEGDTKSKTVEESAKEDDEKGGKENEDDDEDEDEDFKVDEEEDDDEGATTSKRRKSSCVKEEYDSDDERITEPKRRAKRTSAKDKGRLTAAEADVKKYLKLCRELGCRFPAGKFRGVSDAKEKRTMLIEFLEAKGIDVKGERMTQGRIREVRKRLDRDKELAGLDSCNIISEGRAKRRRTSVSYADKDEEEEAVDGEKSPPPPSPERESDSEEYKEESGIEDEDD